MLDKCFKPPLSHVLSIAYRLGISISWGNGVSEWQIQRGGLIIELLGGWEVFILILCQLNSLLLIALDHFSQLANQLGDSRSVSRVLT
jgi:hypothetical protein